MKFPSLKNLAESAAGTIKNYPFETLFALAGTIAATIEIELKHLARAEENWCMRVIMIASLGLLLSLAATLYIRSKKFGALKNYVLKAVTVLFAVSLVFIIDPALRQADYTRFFLLSFAFHLLVAFAAFTDHGQVQGFWQFNRTLFSRFLISLLFGIVLFCGLAAAIAATNFLFNLNFEWDTYQILWVWIMGMFTTLMFLGGVPVNTLLLNNDENYPKGLKVFTQYVLIPLSTVYVFILLAYKIKILIEWRLPKGLVSKLILGYAVFGILSLLLVYPIRNHSENKWLKTYARSFYFLLIPLLILLFIAVGARVFSYGITEFRYFLILLAFWLLFISVYFLTFKQQNIKLIPVSLCILTLFAIYGPQSAFSVSMNSQRKIIVNFFKLHNAFKDGKIITVDSNRIKTKDGSEVVANLKYFIDNYDLTPLQPYLNKDLATVSDSLGKQKGYWNGHFVVDRDGLRELKYEWARQYLGLHHFDAYYDINDDVSNTEFYSFRASGNITIVKGYDLVLNNDKTADNVANSYNGIKITQTAVNDQTYILKLNNESLKFETADISRKLLADSVKLASYRQLMKSYYNRAEYLVPNDMLSLTQETSKYKVVFQINTMEINGTDKKNPLTSIAYGTYLIKFK